MPSLRDPIWISIIVGIFAIIIPLVTSIIIYRKQQQRKSVYYQVISNASVLNQSTQFQGKFQILINGNPLNDAHIVVLKISNNGNTPILPNEYIEPIRFNFGKTTIV